MVNKNFLQYLAYMGMILIIVVLLVTFYGRNIGASKDKVEMPVNVNVATDISAAPEKKDFFSEYRIKRSKLYSEKELLLMGIIKDVKTDDNIRTERQNDLLELHCEKEIEFKIEEILLGRGYPDVILSYDDQTAVLMMKGDNIAISDEIALSNFVKDMIEKDEITVSIINIP